MTTEIIGMCAALYLILACAVQIAGLAEKLAIRFGEPYGTMILTLSAVAVEVIIIGIMMTGTGNPTLPRDTIYSALMFDIAGILGIATIFGGYKHKIQWHNEDGTGAYLVTIIVMSGLVMFVPAILPVAAHKVHGIYAATACVAMYAVFLWVQTKRHKSYFQYTSEHSSHNSEEKGGVVDALMMVGLLVVIAVISEKLAHSFEPISEKYHIPAAVIAIAIAAISASSEILTAIRAALKNNMQAAVNIALGASVSTILLTVPAVEIISLVTGQQISLGLTSMQMMMLGLTLAGAYSTLDDGTTDILEGMALLAIFSGFVLTSFYS